jgi:Tfp pilus assembly protein PilO
MTNRDRLVVIVVVALAVLAGFWFLIIAPKRQQANDLVGQIQAQKDALSQAQQNVTTNTEARDSYNHDYATVAVIGKAVPGAKQIPSLLVQLERAAQKTHVNFHEIDQGASTLGPAPAPPAQASAAVTTANSASTTSTTPTTPTTSTTPVSASSTTTLPPGSTVGAGVTTIPFTLDYYGNYFDLQRYIQAVQSLTTVKNGKVAATGRLLVIGSIDLAASSAGFPQIKAQISATAFMLPGDNTYTSGDTGNSSGANTPSGASTSTGNQAAAASTTPAGAPTPAPAATASVTP